MLDKFVNAFRPLAADTDGTGTYADGLHANSLIRQGRVDARTDETGSLRASYGQDYSAARKLGDHPRNYC